MRQAYSLRVLLEQSYMFLEGCSNCRRKILTTNKSNKKVSPISEKSHAEVGDV